MVKEFINSYCDYNNEQLMLVTARLTLAFLLCSVCYCAAQEDRPLPPLTAWDTSENEVPLPLVFQERAVDPVVMDVRREVNKVSLIARNTAYHPYTLKVRFDKVRNLVPSPDSIMVFVVLPGMKVLMNLRIFDPSQSFDFEFKPDPKIGESGVATIPDFPYLIPISKNRSVKVPSENLNDIHDLQPMFLLNKGDTVHGMRKGVITALPTAVRIDRIASKSIEIRHLDGSIMVYENIDPATVFVRLGETVYPGQALGTCGSNQLIVSLYELQGELLKKLQVMFHLEQGFISPYSGISDGQRVQHPLMIVTKEMNKRELKRMREGRDRK